jgi:hypothetical protein
MGKLVNLRGTNLSTLTPHNLSQSRTFYVSLLPDASLYNLLLLLRFIRYVQYRLHSSNLLSLYIAFWKSLCTYKSCWKWCPRASIQVWTCLILFANTLCRFAFVWEEVQFSRTPLCAVASPIFFYCANLGNDFVGLRSIEWEMSINFLSWSLDGLPLRSASKAEPVSRNFSGSLRIPLRWGRGISGIIFRQIDLKINRCICCLLEGLIQQENHVPQ